MFVICLSKLFYAAFVIIIIYLYLECMYHCLVSLVDGQLKSTTRSQPQVPTQIPQTAVITTSGVSSVPTLPQSSFRWSHAFLAAGFLAASGAGTAVLFKVLGAIPKFILHVLNPLSTSCECTHVP